MEYDYKALGLMCGLEIHQQLNTGKLFIRTPSRLRDDEPDYKIERGLRPVVSELGEFDRAALEAYKKGLRYIYEGYNDTTSLVELDEEPPQPIDEEALQTTIEVSLLFKSRILDELFTMRKMVIDGSNTSGFQRTLMVSLGGEIELKNKTLGIQTIALEEDAARPMEKTSTHITYRLDRLGIPLIELATEPGIKTPEEAKQAAKAIGTLLRLTGKVKRGLGTIRQDVNISIKEGARVEVKGVQELAIIDEYVRREVQRQVKLVEIKKELTKRKLTKKDFEFKIYELNNLFKKTDAKIIKNAIAKKEIVCGIKLKKFAGLLGMELQPNRRLGTEFANYVKTKTGLKGIFHSDELPNYGISEKEVKEVFKIIGCKKEDGFVIVAASPEKTETALRVVYERALQCLEGVPEETRGALEEGNTEYLRPLPGAARMYPETDIDSIIIDKNILKKVKEQLPLSIEERKKLYSKWGLNEKLINEMKTNNFARLFEKKVKEGCDAKKTAVFLLEGLVEARRNGAKIEVFSEKDLEELIDGLNSGKIIKEIQTKLLIEKSKQPNLSIEEVLKKIGVSGAEKGEVEKVVKKIVEANQALVKAKGLGAMGALMGDVMKQLKGKASGKEISNALKKELTKA